MASLCLEAKPNDVPTHSDPLVEPWRWRKEEVFDGLGVLCMDEAKDKTLWFGHAGGVVHYDGLTLESIPFDNAIGSDLAIKQATAIKCLPNNRVLVLMGRRVVFYADGAWRVLVDDVGKPLISSQFITSEDGSVWLLTWSGLWRFKPDLSDASQVIPASTLGVPLSWCKERDNVLWIFSQVAKQQGQFIRIPLVGGELSSRASWKAHSVSQNISNKNIQMTHRNDGEIWLISNNAPAHVKRYDPKQEKWLGSFAEESASYALCAVLEQDDGSAIVGWIGGISRYSIDGKASSLSFDKIGAPYSPYKLFESSNQRLWVLGIAGAVYSVDFGDSEWNTFVGFNYHCETSAGTQWFTSSNSNTLRVVSYNPNDRKWAQYGINELQMDHVFDLFCSSHDLVWAAGTHNRLAVISYFDGKKWRRCEHPKFATRVWARRAFEDQDGTVWFGAQGARLGAGHGRCGGALQFKVNDDRSVELLKHYATPEFPYDVTAFERAPDGVLWLGSRTVHTFDGKTPEATPLPFLQQGRTTVAMTLDNEQSLWIAKRHHGIYRKQGEEWRLFTMNDGLAGLNVSDLILLNDGTLLASSDQGISRFDGTSWTPHVYPVSLAVYRVTNKMHESSNGDLWLNYGYFGRHIHLFPETKGVCVVRHRPEKIAPNTSISYCPEQISLGGSIQVSWQGKDVWSSTPQAELQYAWRIDGGEWSDYAHLTSHTFMRLKRGTYQFEVRARDLAFNVDLTPAKAVFHVVPSVWMQPWFIALILFFVVLVLVLLWLLIQGRERVLMDEKRHLMELDQLKMRFFTNISHELRTPLTVIKGRAEMLLSNENPTATKKGLSIIQRNADRLSGLVNQLLDLRKIEVHKLSVQRWQGDIVPYIKEWVSCLEPLTAELKLTLFLDGLNRCYGAYDLDKTEKIVTNLIANAIKYTGKGGQIDVRVSTINRGIKQLQFIVEDSGIGIDEKHLDHIFDRFYRVTEESLVIGAGIGLDLTKKLVELLDGSIQVQSPIHAAPKRPGTRFIVVLPIHDLQQDEQRE